MEILFHTDPGHGWAEVKLSELKRLGITQKISPYSFISGNVAYLEEDCDLAVYLDALNVNNEEFTFVEKHTDFDSFIRNYNSYRVAT